MENIPHNHFFLVYLQHNIKKLRNNIKKSVPNGKRELRIGQCEIRWKHLQDAFNWDQKNSLPYHHKLTPTHFDLDSASVMRNHLADQVLDKDMKNLVKVITTEDFEQRTMRSISQQFSDIEISQF